MLCAMGLILLCCAYAAIFNKNDMLHKHIIAKITQSEERSGKINYF